MIDTYEKLEEVINDPIHKLRIVATAVGEYSDESDDDVWGTYWVNDEEEINFNVFKLDEEDKLHVWAYALRSTPDEAPYVVQINTSIGYLVATVDFEVK